MRVHARGSPNNLLKTRAPVLGTPTNITATEEADQSREDRKLKTAK